MKNSNECARMTYKPTKNTGDFNHESFKYIQVYRIHAKNNII